MISDAAGRRRRSWSAAAAMPAIVHEWRDGLGGRHLRSTDTAGGHAVDLGTPPPSPVHPVHRLAVSRHPTCPPLDEVTR